MVVELNRFIWTLFDAQITLSHLIWQQQQKYINKKRKRKRKKKNNNNRITHRPQAFNVHKLVYAVRTPILFIIRNTSTRTFFNGRFQIAEQSKLNLANMLFINSSEFCVSINSLLLFFSLLLLTLSLPHFIFNVCFSICFQYMHNAANNSAPHIFFFIHSFLFFLIVVYRRRSCQRRHRCLYSNIISPFYFIQVIFRWHNVRWRWSGIGLPGLLDGI